MANLLQVNMFHGHVRWLKGIFSWAVSCHWLHKHATSNQWTCGFLPRKKTYREQDMLNIYCLRLVVLFYMALFYLSICLSVCLSIYLFIYLSYLSYLSINLSIYIYVYIPYSFAHLCPMAQHVPPRYSSQVAWATQRSSVSGATCTTALQCPWCRRSLTSPQDCWGCSK